MDESSNAVTGQEFDLLIVGAGLVGATVACGLAQERPELRIALLDAAHTPESFVSGDNPTSFDPRVVALSPGSQALLEQIDAWRRMAAVRMCPYQAMHVWDAEGTASITFSSDDLHLPALGHIVENSVAVGALHQQLGECPNVTCLFGKRLVHLLAPEEGHVGPVIVQLEDGETHSASLLVAADGATSKVRDLAGFRTREWNYGHSAIVTTVRTRESHEFTAWQRFQTSGPLAFLPLCETTPATAAPESANGHYSSIVWSVVSEEAERLMQLDDENFCSALSNAFEQRLGPVEWADERICVPLRQRHATHYWKPSIVLVGDAAHSLHPLAGQGVNLGLRDARVLVEEISRACRRQVSLSDHSILKRYERRRQAHNLAAMATMEGFKRLFGAEEPVVRWLRNTGMAFVNEQSWLKKQLAALAIE